MLVIMRAMARGRDAEALRTIQSEIESFIQSLDHPVVAEDEIELFDLSATSWRLSAEFDKLLFEAWNPARSIVRRVEDIAYRDGGKLGVFVRRAQGRETGVLEFRDLDHRMRGARQNGRPVFAREFAAMLAQEFPGWKIERLSHRSDREHSFSTWYTRGLARQGRTGWAFIALSKDEQPAAADGALAFALIWLDWLRSHSERTAIPGLRIFLPPEAIELNAERARSIHSRAVQLEILEWIPGSRPRATDLNAFAAPEARLVPHPRAEALVERHRAIARGLLGENSERLAFVPETAARFTSLRVNGLEVARIEGDLSPKIYFGLEGSVRRMDESGEQAFREFLVAALERRVAGSAFVGDPLYRMQPERWLESMLISDITKVDPGLAPEFVYPQVPAFSRSDRGVIDILSATRDGRLAVIELKLHEEINLPFQALDYWLRVEALRRENCFRDSGYFEGLELSDQPAMIYLVVPAFRFHSTTKRLLRYFDPSITVMQIGINDNWRHGIKVLFRRELRSGL